MHLDTALLFAAFRDAATVEERRRLAREMHDGVAQEIASLGYLVDDIMAAVGVELSPEQAMRLQVLRERLSSVVGEVRRVGAHAAHERRREREPRHRHRLAGPHI